jgi:integrase
MPEFSLGRVNGRFYAVWYEDGRRQRRSLGTDDKAIARAALGEFARQYAFQQQAGRELTVSAIYDSYLADRQAEGKAALPRMRDAWKRLKLTFGDLMPVHVHKDLCRSYTEKRRADGVGDGTIHVELGYLRAALHFATKQGWITSTPDVPLPAKPAPKDHHLTKEEARRLIDAAVSPHVRLFIVLALTTAGRAGAILDLTWMRVDLERRVIRLADPLRSRTRKGRATVPINDLALEALQEARQGALTEWVIEYGGDRVRSIKKGMAASARRAGVICSPHVLRHTAAVHLAQDGHSMDEIAQFLGHNNPQTTFRIYARFSPNHLQRLAASLEF